MENAEEPKDVNDLRPNTLNIKCQPCSDEGKRGGEGEESLYPSHSLGLKA